ncbi:MAG: PepSY-associated TM helix domain-containing protein [Proteiniphilum sp.]|nr:PepSY-associated TM helix domain-containing protein [Proteiniphilum sp.]
MKTPIRKKKPGNTLRRWSRVIHRDLSFFFAGVIIVYALSGILLNHKSDFNAEYSLRQHPLHMAGPYPLERSLIDETRVMQELLIPFEEDGNYTHHYFPDEHTLKVFLKGGSSMVVDLRNGEGLYEEVRRRPLLSGLNRLHYNPHRWWTVFSDIFAGSLVVITLTGIVMNKGKNGIMGRGGIELILGIVIPLLFLVFL